MPVITIRFCTEDNLYSVAIRVYTNSWCSHMEFGWDDNTWLGARFDGGVAIRAFNYCKPSHQRICEVVVTDEQYAIWRKFCLDQLGKPYDWTAVCGIVLRRDWREPDSWFCSELCCACLEAAHKPLLNTTHLNWVYPGLADLSPVPVTLSEW